MKSVLAPAATVEGSQPQAHGLMAQAVRIPAARGLSLFAWFVPSLALGPRIAIGTDLRAPGVATLLDEEEIEIVLLELATNVRRHATGATQMSIRSRVAGDRLRLVVANDGPPARTLCRVGGRGLARLRRMLRAIDARLYLRPSPSGGLVVGVTVPVVARPKSALGSDTP